MASKELRMILNALEDEIQGRKELHLSEMLKSPSAFIRAKAIRESATSEVVLEDVEKYLEDESPAVRKAAIEYLAKTGTDDMAIVRALEDPSETVRTTAVRYIVELGLLDDELKEKIAKEPSQRVRKAFVETMIKTDASFEELKTFENDPSNEIKTMLEVYKGHIPLEEQAMLKLPKKLRKVAIALKVQKIGEKESELLWEKINEFSHPELKTACIEILGKFPPEMVSDKLRKLMDSEDPKIAVAATRVYGKELGYDESLLGIAEKFIDSVDEELRLMGARILKKLSEPAMVDVLRNALNDPSDKVRATVIDALASMLDYSIEEDVKIALLSTSTRLKKSGLRATKRLKLLTLGDHVVRIIANKKEERSVRILAVGVAGFLKITDALVELEKIINTTTNDGKLRLSAAKAMARIAPQRLLELFNMG